ncbi:MarR family winged helix-turn-helix transcriptional regulator [Coraliomargarita sp. SDUM461004]|uniref:MarR family winged helix-turn-helix transcriptional regulator n=1 Tax=Thalassobacterium sedimentorum TaxID=3041258 RepID=A0ABU1AFR9_9BACT|nr:MarR family winged helix-turn-helix transcriptional regulator [Coraliomargarita sp. SDUM461004]MDQ8193674.1 MarR family winged helix-turn-helix transcriptional regulator [Coraliomargarita sp. SDUM461004]
MSTKLHNSLSRPPLDLILDELIRDKNQLLSKSLDAYSLGNGQFHILNEVNWNEGISQEEIARIRKIDKSAVARSVRRLIENGYICKDRDANDARAFRLYPTNKGRAMMPIIKGIIQELDQTFSQGSTPAEIALFKKMCQRMRSNIGNAMIRHLD